MSGLRREYSFCQSSGACTFDFFQVPGDERARKHIIRPNIHSYLGQTPLLIKGVLQRHASSKMELYLFSEPSSSWIPFSIRNAEIVRLRGIYSSLDLIEPVYSPPRGLAKSSRSHLSAPYQASILIFRIQLLFSLSPSSPWSPWSPWACCL